MAVRQVRRGSKDVADCIVALVWCTGAMTQTPGWAASAPRERQVFGSDRQHELVEQLVVDVDVWSRMAPAGCSRPPRRRGPVLVAAMAFAQLGDAFKTGAQQLDITMPTAGGAF
jgi:hypothetical protein